MANIRCCAIAEIQAAPNLAQLLDEYALESSLEELGPARAQFDTYRALEATGMLHPMGAFDDARLVGFIVSIVVVLPHYGVLAATVESFFVLQAERKKGVGLRLLAFAEYRAKALGAKALLLSAPIGSVLAEVMDRRKAYRRSNIVFVRELV